jgi:hypothetical protein
MWFCALLVAASAWSDGDAEKFRSALAELKTHLHGAALRDVEADEPAPKRHHLYGLGENGSLVVPPSVDLPPGWTYKDVVKKCSPGAQQDESKDTIADCLKLVPAVLTGYLGEINKMEAGYKAAHPPPLLPIYNEESGCYSSGTNPDNCQCGSHTVNDAHGCPQVHCKLNCEPVNVPTGNTETGDVTNPDPVVDPDADKDEPAGKLVPGVDELVPDQPPAEEPEPEAGGPGASATVPTPPASDPAKEAESAEQESLEDGDVTNDGGLGGNGGNDNDDDGVGTAQERPSQAETDQARLEEEDAGKAEAEEEAHAHEGENEEGGNGGNPQQGPGEGNPYATPPPGTVPEQANASPSSLIELADAAEKDAATKDGSKMLGKAFAGVSAELLPGVLEYLRTGKIVISDAAKRGEVTPDIQAMASKHHFNRNFATPEGIQREMKNLGALETDLNQQYLLTRKRNAPVLADLKIVQNKELEVERELHEEDQEQIKKTQAMAQDDWERAHRVQPPLIQVGPVTSPQWASNVRALWKQVKARAKEEDDHDKAEQEEIMKESIARNTPSPAQKEEMQLSERLVVDEEEMEGEQPSQDQLLAAGMVQPKPIPGYGQKTEADEGLELQEAEAERELKNAKRAGDRLAFSAVPPKEAEEPDIIDGPSGPGAFAHYPPPPPVQPNHALDGHGGIKKNTLASALHGTDGHLRADKPPRDDD